MRALPQPLACAILALAPFVQVRAELPAIIEPAPPPEPVPHEEFKPARKSLAQLESEELCVRNDASLSREEKFARLRKIWEQQLPLMSKR